MMGEHPVSKGRILVARLATLVRGGRTHLRVGVRSAELLARGGPLTACAMVMIMVASSLMPVLQVWLSKLIVDRLAAGIKGNDAATNGALALAAIYALALVAVAAAGPIQQALAARLRDRAIGEVDRRLMEAGMQLLDLSRIEQPDYADELRRIQDGTWRLPQTLLQMERWLGLLLTMGGMVLLLARLHPLLPVVLVAATLPGLTTYPRIIRAQYQAMLDRSRAAREMDYCLRVTTDPASAKEIRVFGLGEFFLERFRNRRVVAFSEVTRLRITELRFAGLFSVLQAVVIAGGLWYVAAQASAGRLTVGDIALYVSAVLQTQDQLVNLSWAVGFLYETLLYMRGLFSFLDRAKPGIELSTDGQEVPERLQAGITLQDVSFRYPGSSDEVLRDATALLPAGTVTALVGANGAGKSTIVKLLTRMHDPHGGRIMLDGLPLARYDLDSLRRRIAVVYQDFARFALTLEENIAVGAETPGTIDGRVVTAARWAGADEVAARLPLGYQTQLMRWVEGGVDLSGGEWQKVGLARGFVRDAALVILDEPTAALDAEAEYRLFERFRELVAGKTALLISHRFSTVRMADQILVLEDGRIVESGSHAELMALGGRYARLYEMQAGRYRENALGSVARQSPGKPFTGCSS